MNGEFKYLNKFNINYVPMFFYHNYVEFIYQMEHLDLTLLQKKGDQAILNSIAAIKKNKGFQFKADSLQKEIEKIQNEQKQDKNISLNDFIDFIELNLGLNYNIDPSRISASRGYSLFNKAKEKVKATNKRSKKHGRNSPK